MAQLSRPYQIALAAMALFGLVWVLALRGHSGSPGGAGPATPAPAPSASSQASKAAAPSTVYHGKAPGVEGLTRAIGKAHGAVAQSQQNEKQLQEKSAQASSPSAQGAAQGTSSATGSQPVQSATPKGTATTQRGASKGAGAPGTGSHTTPPARQVAVEKELKQGRMVILLFWSPKGADDLAVRRELQLLQAFHKTVGLEMNRRIALHEALANQVGSFGAITRAVQIYQTPTILIINPQGKTKTLTGLTDAYSIQQAISEARRA